MRTFVKHGVLAIAVAALALACGDNQRQVQSPASEPQPQSAFNDPTVQPANDPIANNHNAPRQPLTDTDPQRSTLEAPTAQTPLLTDNEPQKPFYGPGTSPPDNQVLAKTEKPLSDAEVLGVATAANDGEVQMAELAIKKASSPDVKQFAGMMKSHHQTALQKGKALQSKTKLEAAESDVTAYLKADSDKALKELRDKDGKAFDRAYMDAQVKAHKDVLTVIDNRLIPSSNNGEVKSMLIEMRRTVADHLVKAEDIQKKTDPTASASQKDSSKVGIGMPVPKEKTDSPAGKHENQTKARSMDGEPKPVDKR